MALLSDVARSLLDLALPTPCAGCGGEAGAWCSQCRAATPLAAALTRPDPCPPGFPVTAAAGDYDGVLRSALIAHKEHGRAAPRPSLIAALAASIDRVLVEPAARSSPVGRWPPRAVIVPVPSSRAAIRSRGGDPVGAVVSGAVRALGGGLVVLPALSHSRRLADQAGLDATARAANLAGAFTVAPRAHRALTAIAADQVPVVVADDVCTTGATLGEAARALSAAGAPVVLGAVIAATRRLHPGRTTASSAAPTCDRDDVPGADRLLARVPAEPPLRLPAARPPGPRDAPQAGLRGDSLEGSGSRPGRHRAPRRPPSGPTR